MYIDDLNNSGLISRVGIQQRLQAAGGNNIILTYPNLAGAVHGSDWDDWTLACGGGSWFISSRDVILVITSIASNNTLLTDLQKKQMLSNCLGWDCAVRNDCNPYVCKNGSLGDETHELWSYAGVYSNAMCRSLSTSTRRCPAPTSRRRATTLLASCRSRLMAPRSGTRKAFRSCGPSPLKQPHDLRLGQRVEMQVEADHRGGGVGRQRAACPRRPRTP